MVVFHSYLYVYQRVIRHRNSPVNWDFIAGKCWKHHLWADNSPSMEVYSWENDLQIQMRDCQSTGQVWMISTGVVLCLEMYSSSPRGDFLKFTLQSTAPGKKTHLGRPSVTGTETNARNHGHQWESLPPWQNGGFHKYGIPKMDGL